MAYLLTGLIIIGAIRLITVDGQLKKSNLGIQDKIGLLNMEIKSNVLLHGQRNLELIHQL